MRRMALWAMLAALLVWGSGCGPTQTAAAPPAEVSTPPVSTPLASPSPVPTPAPTAAEVTPEPEATSLSLTSVLPLFSVTAKEFLTLRMSDSPKAEAVCTLEPGAQVAVLATKGGYSRVLTSDGRRGYVMNEYLEATGEGRLALTDSPGPYTVVCREFLTLFGKASLEGEVLGRLTAGAGVTLKAVSGEFARVYSPDSQAEGWCLLSYLTPGSFHGTAEEKTPEESWRVSCDQFVSLRELPDAKSSCTRQLPDGTPVQLLAWSGIFARVKAGEDTGWVMGGYLVKDGLWTGWQVQPREAYGYPEMKEDADALAAAYADCRLTCCGTSVQGRGLWALEIGAEDASVHILLQAGIHGRERMTCQIAMLLAEQLLRQGVPEGFCFHILPMTNPDGVEISLGRQDTASLSGIYQSDREAGLTTVAKSRYFRLWKANANGVDLNRNFPVQFGTGSREAPSAQRYTGETALDQPESAALAAYLQSRDFSAAVGLHAYGSLVYGSDTLAEALAEATGYTPDTADSTQGGGFLEWMERQGIPSATVEIGGRNCPLPQDEIYAAWVRCSGLPQALAEYLG